MILLVRDWARDGLLLIGDAAHTMSPAGAIGVNVALATAAVAAQEIYPQPGPGADPAGRAGEGPAAARADVRTLHRLQRRAGRALLAPGGGTRSRTLAAPIRVPLTVRSPLLPRLQRRMFFAVPLPPLDPAFSFRAGPPAVG